MSMYGLCVLVFSILVFLLLMIWIWMLVRNLLFLLVKCSVSGYCDLLCWNVVDLFCLILLDMKVILFCWCVVGKLFDCVYVLVVLVVRLVVSVVVMVNWDMLCRYCMVFFLGLEYIWGVVLCD